MLRLAAGGLAWWSCVCASAQEPTARFEEAVDIGWVAVPVVVRSPGGYVEGLGRKDFRLSVDGRPVPITTFETSREAPVHLVILQDVSGSMATGGKLDAAREAILYLIEQARPADQFAVATFAAENLRVDVPFTLDREAVTEALRSWRAYGTTALHDAVAWVPELAHGRDGVKRAALLITDGLDNASHIAPEEAREIVRRAQLPVYVLGLDTGSIYATDRGGAKIFRNADLLNLLASLSGGRYFPIAGPDELKEAGAELIEDLRQQYVLGFTTTEAGADKAHRIGVGVERGLLGIERRAIYRTSYRGGEPIRQRAGK
jgi:Ca-activated chloride channel family protein